MFQQHANARLEFLQFAAGGESTFGKPNQVLFVFQDSGAKGQARARGTYRLDRQNLSQAAEKTHHRVREDDAGPTGPVGFAKLPPVEQRGDRERIEVTDVIWG